jgi:signal transduction histidine kinase
VTIVEEADLLHLTVADNGTGFDPTTTRAGHLGVSTMTQRADATGARLTVTSAPGAGTTVEVTVPRVTAAPAGSRSA